MTAYLDNASTTRPYPEVIDVVHTVLRDHFGNPSSLHRKGVEAKRILELSRTTIARALEVEPEEVFFTSGGTESNNLAIAGASLARRDRQNRIITTELEHPSVTKPVRNLRREGWDVGYLHAAGGALDLEQLTELLDPATALVSVMGVQNELGYRFPLEQVSRIRTERAPQALLHTDAVQLFCKLPLLPHRVGIDLASLSAHKIGGPKGIGALYVRRGTRLFTTAFGGGQEKGLRSGTEALPLIAGFGKAVEIASREREKTACLALELKAYLIGRLRAGFEQVIVNSREDGSPYIVNFALPGVDSSKALLLLSDKGVFLSTASACESNHATVPPGTWRKKHPLALQLAGIPKHIGKSVFRVSFFAGNTRADIDRLIDALQQTTHAVTTT
ncbi:MAG: cysteine desulfurase [Coriobacteriales bacterium]|nr:cysteine desulfurase [Coriobacteriales bacterium]